MRCRARWRKALAALRSEERDFELRPWLFRIAHNEAISRLRQRREVLDLDAIGSLGSDLAASDAGGPRASARSCAPTCATCPSASARRSCSAS